MNTAELDFGRWIPVDGSAFIRKSQSVEPAFAEREGELTVSLSPYDVPEAMRGRPDEGGRCFIIDFKYLTPSEPIAEAETDTDLVKIYLGKNSGRIYSIRACTDEGQRNVFSVQLESNVQNALEKLEQDAIRRVLKWALERYQPRQSSFAPVAETPGLGAPAVSTHVHERDRQRAAAV